MRNLKSYRRSYVLPEGYAPGGRAIGLQQQQAGFGSTFANDFLNLILQAVAITHVAINDTSSPITNVYLSLHTASPASGNQSTSEAAYTSYARVAEVRSTSSPGFTISSNVATLAANANFPTSTGTPNETETYLGVGQSSSGATLLFFYGALSPTIAVTAAGVTPQITTSTTITAT
jgi:hypothetical protein